MCYEANGPLQNFAAPSKEFTCLFKREGKFAWQKHNLLLFSHNSVQRVMFLARYGFQSAIWNAELHSYIAGQSALTYLVELSLKPSTAQRIIFKRKFTGALIAMTCMSLMKGGCMPFIPTTQSLQRFLHEHCTVWSKATVSKDHSSLRSVGECMPYMCAHNISIHPSHVPTNKCTICKTTASRSKVFSFLWHL